MNKIILMGRLTSDPEKATSKDGLQQISRFSLAVNGYGNPDGTGNVMFIECSAFKKQAEAINTYAKRGTPLLICGRLIQTEWTTKQGEKRRSYAVMVESFDFTQTKKEAQASEPAPLPKEEDIKDEDLPF